MPESGLIPEQRHQRLLEVVRREGVATIRQLSELLGVSHMTVRRDITTLEGVGLVTGVKGGVRLAGGPSGHFAPLGLQARTELELPRKLAIARAAAAMVNDGGTIFLDAGTTCQMLAAELGEVRELTVVTNDFTVVGLLAEHPSVTCLHTGGTVDPLAGCTEGPLAAQLVEGLNLDLYFVSTAGWSANRGVSSPSAAKAQLKSAALVSAARSVLVADSTKYATAASFRVCGLDALDLVITDDGLEPAAADRVRELGVPLEIAST